MALPISLATALAISFGCSAPETTPRRAILVGMDGAAPHVVDRMIAEGRLPTLAKLAQSGVSGPLRSQHPLLSPRVWATIATGKGPEKHGIHNWVKSAGEGKAELYYSTDRKAHALWNIVSAAGMKVAVVNWLTTYPPEIINGVMVSDHTFADDLIAKRFVADWFAGAQGRKLEPIATGKTGASPVFPAEWLPRVRALDQVSAPMTDRPNPATVAAPLPKNIDPKNIAIYHDRDERIARVMLEIDRELAPELTMVLLQGVDRMSHFLYGCTAPPETYPDAFKPGAEERSNCIRVFEAYYEYTDALIGRLIAGYGPNDLVLVVSDHGFEPVFRGDLTGNHDTDAAVHGIFFARGKGLPLGQREENLSVTDIAPMVLAWLGLPSAKDMDGAVPNFLEMEHMAPIESYDTTPIKRVESDQSGEEGQLIDSLRTLGYVE